MVTLLGEANWYESGASITVAGGSGTQGEAGHSQLVSVRGYCLDGVKVWKDTRGVYVVDSSITTRGEWVLKGDWDCRGSIEGAIRSGQLVDRGGSEIS